MKIHSCLLMFRMGFLAWGWDKSLKSLEATYLVKLLQISFLSNHFWAYTDYYTYNLLYTYLLNLHAWFSVLDHTFLTALLRVRGTFDTLSKFKYNSTAAGDTLILCRHVTKNNNTVNKIHVYDQVLLTKVLNRYFARIFHINIHEKLKRKHFLKSIRQHITDLRFERRSDQLSSSHFIHNHLHNRLISLIYRYQTSLLPCCSSSVVCVCS